MSKRIGFISTRFAGTDGVSLESSKWAATLSDEGHQCFWFAGELDRNDHHSYLAPEAHFQHHQIRWINDHIFGRQQRSPQVTDTIHTLRAGLKTQLNHFAEKFDLDLLIVQNALSIPMNIPLGLALVEFLSETGLPAIAHHHDFFWERNRYALNAVGDYLQMAFPPNLPNLSHVVINSAARKALAQRQGIAATTIPNVLDFENPPRIDQKMVDHFRSTMKLDHRAAIILQPTRIIRRKGIEMAVELVKTLKTPDLKLILSHEGGDEGPEYVKWISRYAEENGVDARTVDMPVTSPWQVSGNGSSNRFSLWDVYPAADLVTFPSRKEGFGNALLEAIYFGKPLLVNRYLTFVEDIEPLGFDLIKINGFVTPEAVDAVRQVMSSPRYRKDMTELNYAIAERHFSYAVLRKQLNHLIENMGSGPQRHPCPVHSDENHLACLRQKPRRVRLAG